MKAWILGLVLAAYAPQQAGSTPLDPQREARVQALGKQLRCPMCQGLSIADSNASAARAQMGASFPQLIDQNSGVAVAYGVAGVPETYFIDAQGIIRGKHVGPIDPESLAGWIRELSASPPTAKQ